MHAHQILNGIHHVVHRQLFQMFSEAIFPFWMVFSHIENFKYYNMLDHGIKRAVVSLFGVSKTQWSFCTAFVLLLLVLQTIFPGAIQSEVL